MKAFWKAVLSLVLVLVNGVVAAGDRTAQATISIVSNEFFLMVATIAALLILLKS